MNNHKMIYTALQIKQIPFTMFKENGNDVFTFNDNKIVLEDSSIIINNIKYDSTDSVLQFIQHA